MAGVDLSPRAVPSRSRRRARRKQELHDPGVGGRQPPRELQRIALVVPALRREGVLVVRRDRRILFVHAARDPRGEDLSGVGDVPDDLEGGPLVELGRAELLGGDGPDDPGDRRGVVGEKERLVLVVAEPIHRPSLYHERVNSSPKPTARIASITKWIPMSNPPSPRSRTIARPKSVPTRATG